MTIGLFGGSFNPAHAGHRHASLLAMRRLRLDRVWWLVTPGNPLKDNSSLPPLQTRIDAAEKIAAHPRIAVTGFEAAIGARYTVETLSWLRAHRPNVRFVWLMGADGLARFHEWGQWREIAGMIPIAVIDRPGAAFAAFAPAALALADSRIPERDAPLLASLPPPAWALLHGPLSPLSSTALRRAPKM
jgi:nicotinate-nucleotide adenylyltransferase